MPASTYVPLSSVTLSTAQSQVAFTNIPQTYTDLVLVINAGTTAGSGQTARIVLNGDTSAIYSRTDLSGDGTTAASSRQTGLTSIVDNNVGLNASAGDYVSILNFMNYSNNTTFKTVLQRIGRANTGSFPGTFSGVYLWRNTASINSLSVSSSASTFLVGTTFNLYGVGANTLKATGGDIITTDGTYWYHAFKTSGSFAPVSGTTLSCDVLIVAGGGGAGRSQSGGGGAGGLVYSASNSFSTAQTITIGAGGAAGTGNGRGTNGSNSIVGSLTAAVGGGGGGGYDNPTGANGGSGGGAASSNVGGTSFSGGTATAGQGNNGGGLSGYGAPYRGGGGGGAGAAGTAGYTSSGNGGNGTNTYSTWLNTTGTGVGGYIAGGGGGGQYAGTPSGIGGLGGGGRGGDSVTQYGASGLANTGGGGGGSEYAYNSGSGGSGLVIVRYAV